MESARPKQLKRVKLAGWETGLDDATGLPKCIQVQAVPECVGPCFPGVAWIVLGCAVLCSKFGISFARAAESLGVGYRQEMFESSFLELGKANVTTFMRILEEVMNDGSRAAYVNGGPQMNGN